MFGGFPHTLNEILDKVYNNELRSCSFANGKGYITLFSTKGSLVFMIIRDTTLQFYLDITSTTRYLLKPCLNKVVNP